MDQHHHWSVMFGCSFSAYTTQVCFSASNFRRRKCTTISITIGQLCMVVISVLIQQKLVFGFKFELQKVSKHFHLSVMYGCSFSTCTTEVYFSASNLSCRKCKSIWIYQLCMAVLSISTERGQPTEVHFLLQIWVPLGWSHVHLLFTNEEQKKGSWCSVHFCHTCWLRSCHRQTARHKITALTAIFLQLSHSQPSFSDSQTSNFNKLGHKLTGNIFFNIRFMLPGLIVLLRLESALTWKPLTLCPRVPSCLSLLCLSSCLHEQRPQETTHLSTACHSKGRGLGLLPHTQPDGGSIYWSEIITT